tara:strand:+ start:1868 stop:2614 length:747 start_codon:yes stop_codon:yes gene_type:complete
MNNSNIKISVILPVINETFSLKKTVNIILSNNKEEILEIIIIVSKIKTTSESLKVIKDLEINYKNFIKLYYQDLPFIGGAIQKGFMLSNGTHTIMMASDLETDPGDVGKLIEISKSHPNSIVTASRWIKGGSFKKYNLIKLLLNFIFQTILKVLFLTKLSDMTFGYRIFPTKIVKNIDWEELKHPFLLETIIKPLKMKIDIIEIPSSWQARLEGTSQNSFFENFKYLKIAIKVKFVWKTGYRNNLNVK